MCSSALRHLAFVLLLSVRGEREEGREGEKGG